MLWASRFCSTLVFGFALFYLVQTLRLGKKRISMLSDYRVLDLSDERGMFCGYLLAQLGADVVAIEPPGGSTSRH